MRMSLNSFGVVEAISQLHLAEMRSIPGCLIDPRYWPVVYRDILIMRSTTSEEQAPFSFVARLESTIEEKYPSLVHQDFEDRTVLDVGPINRMDMHTISAISSERNGLYPSNSPHFILARLGNVAYVHWKLQQRPELLENIWTKSVLLHCLCSGLFQPRIRNHLETVESCFRTILEHGLPENARYAWVRLIMHYAPDDISQPMKQPCSGTDWGRRNTRILHRRIGEHVGVAELFRSWDLHNKEEILGLLADMRARHSNADINHGDCAREQDDTDLATIPKIPSSEKLRPRVSSWLDTIWAITSVLSIHQKPSFAAGIENSTSRMRQQGSAYSPKALWTSAAIPSSLWHTYRTYFIAGVVGFIGQKPRSCHCMLLTDSRTGVLCAYAIYHYGR